MCISTIRRSAGTAGSAWPRLIRATDTTRGTDGGRGHIYGVTCCGGEHGGGVVFRIRVPSLASPDLIVSALSPAPAAVTPNALFTVTDTTLNQGPEPAAASRTSYYLSINGTSTDVKLTGNRTLTALTPGEDSSGAVRLRVPATTPLRTYWILACADAGVEVAEGLETNNCRRSEDPVVISRPDLVEVSVSNPPAFAQPGSNFQVTDTVVNQGGTTAPQSSTTALPVARYGERQR